MSEESNVSPLFGSHPQIFKHGEPNEELVNKLNEMLKEANSGYLRAIAFVRVTQDRSIVHGWSGSCDHHDMTAGVAKLNFRFMHDGYFGEEEK